MAAGLSLVWPPNSGPVAGYKAYYGSVPLTYTNFIDAGMVFSIPLPASPRPFYAVIAPYDTNGMEADFSAEMVYPQPVVVGYKLQCSTTVVGGWTNIASHSITNGGSEGSLFFRVMLDVRYQ
jgi:hypothetical protein